MLALAAPPLRHTEAPSSSRVVSRSRQQQQHQRRPLPHSRSTPIDHSSNSTPSRPPPQRSTSTPQLAAVSEPPSTEPRYRNDHPPDSIHSARLDIHAIPSVELLKLLASLLQQIASANDALCGSSPAASTPSSPQRPNSMSHSPIWQTLTSASRTAFSSHTAPLSFHARNIPTISLEAYLLRILKYCPISNEVFLSLLVYFDRMSKLSADATGAVFAIDSYNVHRLVIAGVTVASKFLSDVFYTNTRYAKVGGLPQAELNQLELQFLLLNDFRLVIRREEMQKYAEQLMVYASNRTRPPEMLDMTLEVSDRVAAEEADDQQDDDDEVDAGDGGETTDDEPTIRANHSSASSETQSILTVGSEDTDVEPDSTGSEVYMNP